MILQVHLDKPKGRGGIC